MNTSIAQEPSAPLVIEAVTINIGGYDAIPFEFSYRSDGSGSCRDVDGGGEEIAFTWDPSLIDGFEGEDREDALRDHAHEIFWDEINRELGEDRVLDTDDFGTEEIVFHSGSSEELEHLIRLILYSIPDIWDEERDEVDIRICASTDSYEARVDDYCDLMEDSDISDEDKERISALIDYALDLNEPTGSHLEYNDGSYGRASGYSESANTVSYAIPKPTFHQLAVAREQLIAALGNEDLTDGINKLLPKGG